MKKIVNAILVVEGINDEAFLTSFLDVEIVKTNGYEIPKEDMRYLQKYAQNTNILILTDSDEAGVKIRKRLNDLLPNCINLSVDINKCDKKGKHGVAECSKDEVLRVLKPYITNEKPEQGKLTMFHLLGLKLTGEDSQKNKEKVIGELSLGKCNAKTLLKRLNYRNVEIDILKGILNGNK